MLNLPDLIFFLRNLLGNRRHIEYFVIALVIEIFSLFTQLNETSTVFANSTPECSSMHHVNYETLIQIDFLFHTRASCMESYKILMVHLVKRISGNGAN